MKLRGPVFEDKVIDLIKSKAKIITKTLSKYELIELFNKEESPNNQKEQKKIEKSSSETKTKKKKPVTSKTSSKK